MSILYDRLAHLCAERGIKGGRMCSDLGLSKSLMTDLKMGRKSGISAITAQKIASYFGVTVGYLLGEETEKMPDETVERKFTDGEIMFALSRGGEAEITDEMFEEVKNFAAYIAQREAMKKKKGAE